MMSFVCSLLIKSEPQPNSGAIKDEYCANGKCYTATQFGLFGFGIAVMGVIFGVVLISYFSKKCNLDEANEIASARKALECELGPGVSDRGHCNGAVSQELYVNINGKTDTSENDMYPSMESVIKAPVPSINIIPSNSNGHIVSDETIDLQKPVNMKETDF